MASTTIPQFITVHLGTPSSNAENVTVPFPEYIKNVASGEIYPTWPESAIRANIYAQISFALNRVFTEYYRSRGYDFDITNSTTFDQYYSPNREIFENISQIVDEVFNSYVQKENSVGPYFTQYCDGRRVSCQGLSQWGTVALANQGFTPFEILQYYYGDDINIVRNVPISLNVPSYPGTPLTVGSGGLTVLQLQIRLNRISDNYPSIPKIFPVDGIFGPQTENAVKTFQRIFNLSPDGVVGSATWYKIIYIYNAVKRLSELDSEGIALDEYSQQYKTVLRFGDSGTDVRLIQFFLSVLSQYYETLPPIVQTSVFDEQTENAVRAFQREFNLDDDGIVGRQTWDVLYNTYLGIADTENALSGGIVLYGGDVLRLGSQGEEVRIIQQYLNYIANTYTQITKPSITGYFGTQTQTAVRQFQELFGLTPTGAVGPVTWNEIAYAYSDLERGNNRNAQQFAGYTLTVNGQNG